MEAHLAAGAASASNVLIEEVMPRTSLQRPPDKSLSRIGLTSLCTFWDGV